MTLESTRSRVAKSLFEENLTTIQDALRRAAVQRLPGQEVEDFVSWGLLRIIESGYRCLREYRGSSRLATFLGAVASRMVIDYYRRLRGVWRPSAAAKRHGEVGIELERLISRDQVGVRAAVRELRHNHRSAESTGRLHEIAAQLPCRADRFNRVPAEIVDLHSRARASDRVNREESRRSVERVAEVVRECFAEIPEDDRMLLVARFVERRTVADIARELGVPAKPLYRRIERCLEGLRQRALAHGLTSDEIRCALEGIGQTSVQLLDEGDSHVELPN